MKSFCVFGGTGEGRKIAGFLCGCGASVTVCVATEYGKEILPPSPFLTVRVGRMNEEEMEEFLRANDFGLVIDATHPYAAVVTASVSAACARVGCEHIRVRREESAGGSGAFFAADIEEAVRYLSGTEGNILVTTGGKEIGLYAKIPGFEERVYARILPAEESFRNCLEAGLTRDHIIAMQGPFSEEMNTALIHQFGIKHLVTKDGGEAGGFPEKMSAAEKTGTSVVVIGRPRDEEGVGCREAVRILAGRYGLSPKRRAFIIGMGTGSGSDLTVEALSVLKNADCVAGSKRMTETALRLGAGKDAVIREVIGADETANVIREHPECESFAFLMSGDTGFFSGTKKLIPLLDGTETKVIPGISSESYLAARTGMSYDEFCPVSLHGRTADVAGLLKQKKKLVVLLDRENSPSKVCREHSFAGMGDAEVTIGERLGYEDERIIKGTADELKDTEADPLSVMTVFARE